MAQRCDICGRGALVGNTRSHSNIATKTRRKLNLQAHQIDGHRRKVCASCLKTRSARA